jgi:hypothetical protein
MSFNLLGSPAARARRPWLSPLNLLIAGAAATVLAGLMAMTLGDRLVPLRVMLILAGLALALSAVNHRLRNFAEALEDRGITAVYLTLATFVVLIASLACDEEWDSFRLVLGVFVGIGLIAALLVMLPRMVRRTFILLLVLFHFGGILTAVFSVPPPSGLQCWMTGTLWTYVYRPYLQFMYLNNAYHFYSPEPGPATHLWFCVKYDSPNVPPRWVDVPRREDYPSRLLYQRATALTETTTYPRYGYPADIEGRVWRRSQQRDLIPYLPDLQVNKGSPLADVSQYREPQEITSKKYIASYARHVARDPKYRSPDSPDTPVRSVKVYRVMHNLLNAQEMARGESPESPTKFWPFYMGEFDADGNLLDPNDPLLYWAVPILAEQDKRGVVVIKDYVAVHAGSKPPFVREE